MNEEEKKKILEIAERIGYKVGTYCNDEEIEVFEKFLEDYKDNLIEKQQAEIEDLKKSVDYTYEAYQDAGKKMFDYAEEIEKKDNAVRNIIARLENDIKRITETKAKKSEGLNYLDDYTRNRLQAYKTKTKEIKEYIEEQYFERKIEQ